MIVYVLTFGNGKQYVGVTCDLKRRLQEHRRRPGLIRNAINKHGMSWKVVFKGSRDGCLAEDVQLISKLGCFYPDGYNRTSGGEGNDGSPEMAEAIRRGIAESPHDRRAQAVSQWSNPEKASALLTANEARWADPESRERSAQLSRARWADPSYRARVSKRIREALAKKA